MHTFNIPEEILFNFSKHSLESGRLTYLKASNPVDPVIFSPD